MVANCTNNSEYNFGNHRTISETPTYHTLIVLIDLRKEERACMTEQETSQKSHARFSTHTTCRYDTQVTSTSFMLVDEIGQSHGSTIKYVDFACFLLIHCCRQVRELKARDEKLKSAESFNNFQQEVHLHRGLTQNGSQVGVIGKRGGGGGRGEEGGGKGRREGG